MKVTPTAVLPAMLIAVIFPFVILCAFTGCTNPSTPAGYVGYVTRKPYFARDHFYETQKGPISTGLGWRLFVTNVRITPITQNESFTGSSAVLSRDNLLLEFRTHLIWRIRPEKVEEFVEKYSGSNDEPERAAYSQYLQETFRTYSRDEVQKIGHGLDVKDNLVKIGDAIKLRMSTYVGTESPFDIIQCQVGNIQYPIAVSNAVASKLAATQRLEQADTEVQIEKKKALIREADATGVAEAMNIINQKLTPQYLQHEAIEAQKAMAGAPNHTVIYIPVGKMGVPLVGTFDSAQKEQ